jgi:hypothetical protein
MKAGWIAVFPLLGLAQSVVSTHSGVVHFFEGTVSIGDQQLEQKFGRFPEIGEGRELRTEHGRAEVLLTPGVILRLDENSAIRLLSNKLSDTRVELLAGSGILEAKEAAADTSVALIYKDWQVRVPKQGVYAIDAQPARVQVYKGEVEVSAEGQPDTVRVRDGEVLPLATVLVTEQSAMPAGNDFKSWAMSRSDAVAADNSIAAEILDDPTKVDIAGLDAGALGGGGFSYFPLTGIPSIGITNPYGLGFWSPYQATLSSMYFPVYLYGRAYPGWTTGLRLFPRPIGLPARVGSGRGLGFRSPSIPYTPPVRIGQPVSGPHTPAPRTGIHAGRR